MLRVNVASDGIHPTGMPAGESGGYETVYWDIDVFDWEKTLSKRLAKEICKKTIPARNVRGWENLGFRGPDFRQNRFDW